MPELRVVDEPQRERIPPLRRYKELYEIGDPQLHDRMHFGLIGGLRSFGTLSCAHIAQGTPRTRFQDGWICATAISPSSWM